MRKRFFENEIPLDIFQARRKETDKVSKRLQQRQLGDCDL